MGHVQQGPPLVFGQLAAPGPGKFLSDLGIKNRLVSRQHCRQRAHVAGALDVILAAQGINAGEFLLHMTGEHGQVGIALHIGGAADMLGHAQAVADCGPPGMGIGARRPGNQ